MTTKAKPAPKPHPWRAFAPGWLKSDYKRGDQVIPAHARVVRK